MKIENISLPSLISMIYNQEATAAEIFDSFAVELEENTQEIENLKETMAQLINRNNQLKESGSALAQNQQLNFPLLVQREEYIVEVGKHDIKIHRNLL